MCYLLSWLNRRVPNGTHGGVRGRGIYLNSPPTRLLAAEQYGLGACWVHIRNRSGNRMSSDEEIRELLGVPEDYAVLNLVAIGSKAENKMGYAETDFDMNKVHYEQF